MNISNTIKPIVASGFKDREGIEYFRFEEDFIEDNMRCIPMIIRFKLDMVGIKLKLSEWSKFKEEERIALALLPVNDEEESGIYNNYLRSLVKHYSGNDAEVIEIKRNPEPDNEKIPGILSARFEKLGCLVTGDTWRSLTPLQRFALVKLVKEGHENKNFPKAIIEFGLDKK